MKVLILILSPRLQVPGSLAGRYLAAVNSGPGPRAGPGSCVRLTSSVRQTRELLLIKTGQAKQATGNQDWEMSVLIFEELLCWEKLALGKISDLFT